jgi:hypothetical protein
MAIYDSIDFSWSWDGDYIEGLDGDLKDSSGDKNLLESLVTEVHTVLRSETGDWLLDPSVGANLSDFRGEPNNRNTGKGLEQRVKGKLIATGIIRQEDLNVRVVPVGRHEVLTIIKVNATATPLNGLTPGQPLIISLVYDTLEDSVFFLDETEASRRARSF